MDEVTALLDNAERSYADVATEPFEPSAGKAASFLVNIPARIALDRAYLADLRGDGESTATFATQALAEIREDETMLKSHAVATLAMADWLRGQPPRGRARLRVQHHRVARGRPFRPGPGGLGIPVTRSGPASPGPSRRGAPDLPAGSGHHRGFPAGCGAHGRHRERGAGRDCLRPGRSRYGPAHVTESITRNRQLVYTPLLAIGLALLAWIKQAEGDLAGALDSMGEAARLAPDPGIASLLNPVPAERARLLLAQGDVAAAGRWVQERGLSADDELAYPREAEYLVLARLLVAQDLPGRALVLLERLHAAAVGHGRVGASSRPGHCRPWPSPPAVRKTRPSASWPRRSRSATPKVTCGSSLTRARRCAPCSAGVAAPSAGQAWRCPRLPVSYLARLLRAFDLKPAESQAAATAVPGLPAWPRPADLPRAGGAGAAGRGSGQPDIAAELVVTLDTVKRHVTHILAKLGAVNRTEAVARARELNLIP